VNDHILADLGKLPIASINRRLLQEHLDRLAGQGLSRSVVGHVRWQLKAIFEMACSDGLLPVNPAAALVMPRCKDPEKKKVLSSEEIQKAEIRLDLRDRLIFRLAAYEGLRPGEIVGLQVGDIRPDGIHIARRIYRGNVDTPKSDRSRRVVPPSKGTKLLLEAYMETLFLQENDAWLFPSEALKTPVSYANVWRRRIGPVLKSCGITGANYQILRRTWVTDLAEVEPNPEVRADLAGHGADTNSGVYRQAKLPAMQRAIENMEESRRRRRERI
jgi:integrase